MFDIRNVYTQTFLAIKNDTKLLDLLEIEYEDVDENTFLTNLRKQITETSSPEGLLNDYSTRVCVHERDGGRTSGLDDVGYLCVDIHIPKDKNKLDNRLSRIATRVIEVLDTKERRKQGLPQLNIGLYGLTCKGRVLDELANNTGWEKYRITFEYTYLI